MELFRRAWRAQVGTLDVSSLSLRFKVVRTLYARAGTLELEIRNLSEEHRRELTTARRFHTFVELHAGYQGGMAMLFRGDLRKAVPSREGTTWTVKVTAGDGEHAIRTARVSRSFAPGTTLSAVVQHIAEAMGVGAGNAVTALRGASLGSLGETLPEGTVLHGSAATELSRLCAAAGRTWSVQDGNLQVLPLGGSLAREAILLSSDTGLVEAPEVVSRRCITAKALLIPGLVPGQTVAVQSGVVARTVWRITEAEYSGDTHGHDWYASLTLHRPAPPLVGSAASNNPNPE